MAPPKRRRLGLAVAVVLACVGAAVVPVLVGGDGSGGEALGTDATEQFVALDGLAGTVERVAGGESAAPRIVRRVRVRPGTGAFWARTVVGPEGKRGTTVSNGSTTWVYSDRRNRAERHVEPVVVGPKDRDGSTAESPAADGAAVARQSDRLDRVEHVEQLFERLNVSAAAADRAAGRGVTVRVSTLPVVPGPDPDEGALPAVRSGQFRLTFDGTDRVAGRPVYVLRVASVGDHDGRLDSYTRTLSVDAEHFAVLRDHVETVVEGRRSERTWVYRNVTFDPGIDDERFRFEPPANATVETHEAVSERIYTYTSRRELAADTTLELPAPELPRTFGFERGVRRPGTGSIRLEYANATARVRVDLNRAGSLTRKRDPDTTVRIGGREVVHQRAGVVQSFSWRCGEYQYYLAAEGLSDAAARSAVASLSCPT